MSTKTITFLALGVTAIALIVVIIGTGLTGDRLRRAGINPMKYGIVLDAGSSHTALFIYEWPAEKQNDTGVIAQRHLCDVKGGGISSYKSSPSGAGESLRACMDEAKAIVPKDRWADTPLALGATAGMRLLEMSDSVAAKAVLSSVREVLDSSPFSYHEARIISGQEEGTYGWMTANYFLYNFIQFTWLGKWQWTTSTKPVGALDLGGASTQITFMTEEPLQGSPDSLTIQLYGRKYHVYSHSYLCYGRDQAIKRFLSTLYKASPGAQVDNPCYPTLYSVAYNLSSIYDSPCTSDERPANYDPNQSVTFRGTADPAACNNTISSIFNFSACSSPNCTFDGVWQPPVQGQFLAFSTFFYTMDAFNLTDSKASLNVVTDTFDSHCAKTWTEVTAQNPGIKADRLKDYCFQAYYVYTLLIKGYKFDTDNWQSITFQRMAGGGNLGWALGFMLNVTNRVPVEMLPELYSTAEMGLGFLATLLILTFIIVLFWVHHLKRK
ncbi:ectonucleoside triphosphate diphosphohydrolase 2-like [Lethenteron reissneri]|uniref:ectonucleoside triphosphate diphosphohydrolase 2-like n=1 Tax=Lethenteron reissneri TaxID=7753 RepID=UPI002AB676A1|nr:ectonucleoside triphosphate diphosphohydrolase 2-like [Lethenteron reissneri]XP_061408867.1 ectonucleoside triphosphate diphosphohydrolase 2-like [Lethenteron reissneri]XP_061408868.1 ectonucleoside triphosphate diphosphohydrolase 2-like [Lethenteron reissneri]XP_061408869.1 ectonucleoside triphosphate diphosphohydrolase 2-like [Lethenteron reissneri]XP_061408870.1 ectonucleoside triphosphate diphosphohydrolase 2-like [Lethenteron reissneri]